MRHQSVRIIHVSVRKQIKYTMNEVLETPHERVGMDGHSVRPRTPAPEHIIGRGLA